MPKTSYPINKGINRSIVFRGLKGQYIWYMGGAMFGIMILYAIMYVCGINTYVSLLLTVIMAAAAMTTVFHLSQTYGEHGLTKAMAARLLPKLVKSTSRSKFIKPGFNNGKNAR
jgi:hypothetical protein